MRAGRETSVCSPRDLPVSVCRSPAPGAGRRASKTPRGGQSGSPQARGHIRPWPGLQQPWGQPEGPPPRGQLLTTGAWEP